jgi:hypothetical protein
LTYSIFYDIINHIYLNWRKYEKVFLGI